MKVLLVHPGTSIQRHFNFYHVIMKLLEQISTIESYYLTCQRTVYACDFRSGYGQLPDSKAPLKWIKKCITCPKKLKSKIESFSSIQVSIKDYITRKEKEELIRFIGNIPKKITVNELIKLEYRGVNVGIDIWSSVQRYCFIGKPEILNIKANSILYKYIKTGLIFAVALDNLFNDKKYDLILQNEVTYISWGIPMRVALKHKIPVLHSSSGYLGKQYQFLNLYKNVDDLIIAAGFPKSEEIKTVYNSTTKFNEHYNIGLEYLGKFIKQFNDRKINIQNRNNEIENVPSFISLDKKNVVIFTHQCWDSSLGFGKRIFETFEDWLTETFNIAIKNKNVNWIFKIHPGELDKSPHTERTSETINTNTHLLKLLNNNPSNNIHIFNSVKNDLLFPYIDACVSVIGTCRYEFPSVGIPVILAEKKLNAQSGFVYSPQTNEEYRKLLNNIDSLTVTNEEKKLATAYAGIYANKKRYLDVSSIFPDMEFETKNIDTNSLENWLNKKENIRYIKNILK